VAADDSIRADSTFESLAKARVACGAAELWCNENECMRGSSAACNVCMHFVTQRVECICVVALLALQDTPSHSAAP